jgi:KaiC/GvpD/RAD55 family RecA-like ATPase
MEGGIPSDYITLICGRAGTMKSTLSFGILFNNALLKKKRGIYVTLEQSRESLLEHMIKLGMNPRNLKDSGIVVMDMAQLRDEGGDLTEGANWIDYISNSVMNCKIKYGCDLFVLDSLAALYSIATFEDPRRDVFFLFERLRELGMATFVISEMLDPNKDVFGAFGVEDFLADGIIHLDLEKQHRHVDLYLSVVKMRKTDHDRTYYPLIFEGNKFEIVAD